MKSYPFTLVIGLDEYHTSLLQRRLDHRSICPMRFMLAVFESTHRTSTDAGTLGEFFLGPIKKRASGATLFGTQHD